MGLPRSPYVVAALVVISGIATALHLADEPGPFDPSSLLVITLGIVIFTLVTCAGLLLARGRWSRRLGTLVVVGNLTLVAIVPPGPWAVVAVVTGIGALVGLLGRWLDGWVRPRPSAIGPDPKAVLILLGLLGFVPLMGLASPAGLTPGHGLLGAAALLLAWGYGKAQIWALWAMRVALPLVAIPAVASSPPAGAVAIVVLTGAVVWLAWSRQALLSVQPLPTTLPGPRPPRAGEPQPGTAQPGTAQPGTARSGDRPGTTGREGPT